MLASEGSGKEQTASIYAELLSREGFAALAFAAAYQGETESEPTGPPTDNQLARTPARHPWPQRRRMVLEPRRALSLIGPSASDDR